MFLPKISILFLFSLFSISGPIFTLANDDKADPYIRSCFNKVIATVIALRKLVVAFGLGNAIASVLILAITLLIIVVYNLKQGEEPDSNEKVNLPALETHCRRFSFEEIQSATQNFDSTSEIGHGGFGKVYKGIMDVDGPINVAIKRLNPTSKQGGSEFRTEIEMLSKFRHTNLVSLIGYCDFRNEMILVYEYMHLGTIADHLHADNNGSNGNSPLSWQKRLKICIGAARGLDFLHTGTGVLQRVIHRDVKSSNILLDENWMAKIADFGLSKIGPANQSSTQVCSLAKGTIGYMDPHYLLTGKLTWRSDVYSFGVVLLEALCGRRAFHPMLPSEQQTLATWAQRCIKEGNTNQIIDPGLKFEIFPDSLMKFMEIVNKCLHAQPEKRPRMGEVVTHLQHAWELQEKMDYSTIVSNYFNEEASMDPIKELGVVTHSHEDRRNINFDYTINERPQKKSLLIPKIIRRAWQLFSTPVEDVYRGEEYFQSDSGYNRVAMENFSVTNEFGQSITESKHNDGEIEVGETKEQKDSTLINFSGRKSYMIPSRELTIEWQDHLENWRWISLPESRFEEVAELVCVYWLDIRCKIGTDVISPTITYAAIFVFKMKINSRGFDGPVKSVVRFDGETLYETRDVFLKPPTSGKFPRAQKFQLPRERKDGWMEIELGKFCNDEENDGKVEIRLMEIEKLHCKEGLVVKGIELRPIVNGCFY